MGRTAGPRLPRHTRPAVLQDEGVEPYEVAHRLLYGLLGGLAGGGIACVLVLYFATAFGWLR